MFVCFFQVQTRLAAAAAAAAAEQVMSNVQLSKKQPQKVLFTRVSDGEVYFTITMYDEEDEEEEKEKEDVDMKTCNLRASPKMDNDHGRGGGEGEGGRGREDLQASCFPHNGRRKRTRRK